MLPPQSSRTQNSIPCPAVTQRGGRVCSVAWAGSGLVAGTPRPSLRCTLRWPAPARQIPAAWPGSPQSCLTGRGRERERGRAGWGGCFHAERDRKGKRDEPRTHPTHSASAGSSLPKWSVSTKPSWPQFRYNLKIRYNKIPSQPKWYHSLAREKIRKYEKKAMCKICKNKKQNRESPWATDYVSPAWLYRPGCPRVTGCAAHRAKQVRGRPSRASS